MIRRCHFNLTNLYKYAIIVVMNTKKYKLVLPLMLMLAISCKSPTGSNISNGGDNGGTTDPGHTDPGKPKTELTEQACRDIENAYKTDVVTESKDDCEEEECSKIAEHVHIQLAVSALKDSALASFDARKGNYFDEVDENGSPKFIAVKELADGSVKYPCLTATDLAAGEAAAMHMLARLHGTEACQGECKWAADASLNAMLAKAKAACEKAGLDEWETATDMYIVQQAYEAGARQSFLDRGNGVLHDTIQEPKYITAIKQSNGLAKFPCLSGKDLAAGEAKAKAAIEEVCHE